MADKNIEVQFDPPELEQELPPELVADLNREAASDARAHTLLVSTIALLALKLGLDSHSAIGAAIAGYGAIGTGIASAGYAVKNMIDNFRIKREYRHKSSK